MDSGERLREMIAKNKAEREAFASRSQELQKIIISGTHDQLAQYVNRLEASFSETRKADGEDIELDTSRGST